jgi:hypothetical protein
MWRIAIALATHLTCKGSNSLVSVAFTRQKRGITPQRLPVLREQSPDASVAAIPRRPRSEVFR